jgi:CO/xanthine dehydrogenase Mo-binding subunit
MRSARPDDARHPARGQFDDVMADHPLPAILARHPTIGDWLRLDGPGVVAFSGKVEFGQGAHTALAQLVAHELYLPVELVEMAAVDTAHSPDEGVTSGSRTIEEAQAGLREAAAELRCQLIDLAAHRLGQPRRDLVLEGGCVRARDGTAIPYRELAGPDLYGRPLSGKAPRRPPGGASPVGLSVPRLDLPDKVLGRPAFIGDVVMPNMLHGRVVRPPGFGARLIEVDVDDVRTMPGVVSVVMNGSFLGVVAEREEQAMRAARRLRRLARWVKRPTLPESERFLMAAPTQDVVVDATTAPLPGDTAVISAEYSRPYLAHASIGPSLAIATYREAAYEVHSHSQGIYHLRQELSKVLGVPEASIRVSHHEGAGCYGANGADDAALDAALLARSVPGRPVRVQWMREDEFGWEPLGTAMVVRCSAHLAPDGEITHWSHEVWGNGHRDRAGPDSPADVTNLVGASHLDPPFTPSVAPPPPSRSSGNGRNAAPPYRCASRSVINHYVAETPLRVSALRSLGAHANVFASESFMDEIADRLDADPLEHRLRYLDDPRAREVLVRTANAAGWPDRPLGRDGRGLGIGYARYKNAGAYVAVIVEVDVDRDITLRHAWATVDAGLAINPDGIRNQAEGGIVQAASWTLKERVQFDRHRVTSTDWDAYPILRFDEVPEVAIEVIDRPDERPRGVGEAFAGPAAAAIGNAIFAATGARLRDLPLTRERLMRALS